MWADADCLSIGNFLCNLLLLKLSLKIIFSCLVYISCTCRQLCAEFHSTGDFDMILFSDNKFSGHIVALFICVTLVGDGLQWRLLW